MEKYIISYDLGTTGSKTVLFNEKGGIISSVYHSYPTYTAKPTWAEQDPEHWWKAICEGTKQILEKVKISPKKVAGISFSGQMMGSIPVDKDGICLRRKVLIWADARAREQAKKMVDRIGFEKFYKITGGGELLETYSIAKILWQKENEPEIFKRTYKFLQAKDYLSFKLTGNFVTDFSDASNSGLFDINHRKWSEELLEIIGLDKSRLPEIYKSTEIAGKISDKASMEIGLLSGTPVIVGGGDMACAATGAGLFDEGASYIYLGSAAWATMYTESPLFDLEKRPFILCHTVPNAYLYNHSTYSGGICYQWIRDAICTEEKRAANGVGIDVYKILDLKAAAILPGSEGLIFLPYMRGGGAPYHNPDARGVLIGLSLNHSKDHFIRAVLEGVALNLRIFLDDFLIKGAKIKEIPVIGGGAKGRLWKQIIADVTKKSTFSTSMAQESTSFGAAITGMIGLGILKDFKEAKTIFNSKDIETDICFPNSNASRVYDEVFPIFKDAYMKLINIFAQLDSL